MHKSSGYLVSLASTSAAASEEMSATAVSISENATHAKQFTYEATSSADTAVGQMDLVSHAMELTAQKINELETASSDIQEIVSAIDGIADQTNLLALNAAIEAARAGEAGLGFAVVADEVKKLSIRSQESTQEIINTIAQVQKNIESAVEAVSESSKNLNLGVNSVKNTQEKIFQVNAAMEQISDATNEQREATGQISESVQSVLKEANNNSELAENVWNIFDDLVTLVEQQRTILAEQKIENKVLYLAKADHALWKKKIMDFEAGRIQLEESEAGDHTICRLGKWYYNQGLKDFAQDETFAAIETPHKKVHECARAAIRLRNETKNADIRPIIAELNQASDEVVKYLDILIENNRLNL